MKKSSLTFLCVSRFFKGAAFIRACHAAGNKVYLLTSSKLRTEDWPHEALEGVFYMEEDVNKNWNMKHVVQGLAHQMRSIKFDRLVSLDDFDVENTAHLREHFRIPGMGETTSRYFRDKLAMRMQAKEAGIPAPAFTSLFHDADIHAFTDAVQPPWLIKPRTAASAMGIRKIQDKAMLWAELDQLGDQRHNYLLENFEPGHVFHVDCLNVEGKVVFSRVSQYLDTPLEVSQGGGIFRSQTVELGSPDDKELTKLNAKLMKAFGMKYSASHSEFIKGKKDGKFYFLETASRVGGAHLAEMVEAASGINLWAEWAKIETAVARGDSYQVPKTRNDFAGIVVSLSKYEHPDSSIFDDEEICWRINKKWHIGMIVRSSKHVRIRELLDTYTQKIAKDFHASLPQEKEPRN